MDDVFVGQLMTSSLQTVSRDTLVEDAAELMLENNIGSVVVVDDDNRLEGILTTTDFVEVVAGQKPKDQTPVEAYMTTDVITTTAQNSIRDVSDLMIEHGFHHVPVVDDTEGVIGMISTTDFAAYISHVETPSPA
jgi:CBS domain-containing protein